MSSVHKLYEAQQHIKSAEKHLKTTMFKWKPDYDSAADEYNQAGVCYKIARDTSQAKICFLKAMEYYQMNGSFYHAAKSIESALLLDKNLHADEIYSMAMDASSLYQQHGSGDAAARILDKAGVLVMGPHPDKAAKLFHMASDIASTQGDQHVPEYLAKASRMQVKCNMFDEASHNLRRELEYRASEAKGGKDAMMGRQCVALVLVHLAREDIVAAQKAFQEWGYFCEKAERMMIDEIFTAFEDSNRAAAIRGLRSPFIRAMDVEFSRLASVIHLPPGDEPVAVETERGDTVLPPSKHSAANAAAMAALAAQSEAAQSIEAVYSASAPWSSGTKPADHVCGAGTSSSCGYSIEALYDDDEDDELVDDFVVEDDDADDNAQGGGMC